MSEAGPDDAEIIEQSHREPERFAVLFDRHAPHIHRYVARRLGAHIADDLVAETFLTAFRKRHRYDTARADARPWLYGIATNLVGDHRRAEVREFRLRKANQGLQVIDGHEDRVTAQVSVQSLRPMVAAALAELAVGDRDVLLLIAWEQLSYEEVAIALDIPVGTVRSRLNRARRKVRKALGESTGPADLKEIIGHA